jgi:uncharacterized membrane protein
MVIKEILKMHNDAIAKVDKHFAIAIMLLNLVLPGSGTVALGVFGPPDFKNNLLLGLIMFVLSVVAIGWIWSIIFGIKS